MAMERVGLCGNTRPLGPLAQQMQPPTAFRVICATNKVNAEINANATAGLNGWWHTPSSARSCEISSACKLSPKHKHQTHEHFRRITTLLSFPSVSQQNAAAEEKSWEKQKRAPSRPPPPQKRKQEKNPAPDLNTRGLSCKRKCRRSQSQNYHNYYPHSLLLWQSFPTFPHVSSFLPFFARWSSSRFLICFFSCYKLSVSAFPLLSTDYCLSIYFPLFSCQCHFLVVNRFYCFSIFVLLLYCSFSPSASHSFLSFLIRLLNHFPNFPAPSNSKTNNAKLQKHLFIFLPCTPVFSAFLSQQQ